MLAQLAPRRPSLAEGAVPGTLPIKCSIPDNFALPTGQDYYRLKSSLREHHGCHNQKHL